MLGASAAPAHATLLVKSDGNGLLIQDKNGLGDTVRLFAARHQGSSGYGIRNLNAFDIFKFDVQNGCAANGERATCFRGGPQITIGLGDGGDVLNMNGFGSDPQPPAGQSSVTVGPGNDTATGHPGSDDINGETGNDDLTGGSGNDERRGSSGIDVLKGGSGNDRLFAGFGDDRLEGSDGDDLLVADEDIPGSTPGSDVLIGGRGRDVLSAGSGNDSLDATHRR